MAQSEWSENSASALLRKHGLRVTSPRVAICMQLLRQHCHYTAQQLHEKLSPHHPSMSPNTVYLTLNQLASVGVIRCFNLAGNTVFDSNTSIHEHAYCRECGILLDLPSTTHTAPTSPGDLGEWFFLEWRTRLWSGFCPFCKVTVDKTV